jgi:hypothetical protein
VYKLEWGNYQLLEGEPIWLEEIGLGIGKERGAFQGIEREWLYWYDREGKRYLTPEERLKTSEDQAREAQEKAKILAAKLRSLGIDPNE